MTKKKQTKKTGPDLRPFDQVNVVTPSHSGIFNVDEVADDGTVILSDPATPGRSFRVSVGDILVAWRPVWHR